jgi:hypothetical protein
MDTQNINAKVTLNSIMEESNDNLSEVVDKIMNEEKDVMNPENSKSIIFDISISIYLSIYWRSIIFIHPTVCALVIQLLIACLLLA